MGRIIEKVTGFVTRPGGDGNELLLFRHPYAGIQIPAGTVEPGETPERAVLREIAEETGLAEVVLSRFLGIIDERLPDDCRVIAEATRVYARPDLSSFDWAYIRPGITVRVMREARETSMGCAWRWTEFRLCPSDGTPTQTLEGERNARGQW